MKTTITIIKRNVKLFFKDKGMFFTSLITPAILLVLYAAFLGNVYRDSFTANMPDGIQISDSILDGLVGGQLISSILAVSCVTVAFCSNFLMVQDKATGIAKDFYVSPVKSSTMSLCYYVANLITTLLVCFAAAALCLIYIAFVGWYMSFSDVMLMLLDVLILVLFGTALSSVINYFLSTQGQISAVGTIISSGYGFICGAYMPISSFGEGLQTAVKFLPGTYGTSLLRNHATRGVLSAMEDEGIPIELTNSLRDLLDCNLYIGEKVVEPFVMYLIISVSVLILVSAYVALNKFVKKK